MNANVGRPEIGQWYGRTDNGELFQVVGRDEHSRAIEIQCFDGDVDEIDAEVWNTLPLERNEPPEDWTAAMDVVEPDGIRDPDTATAPTDWARPLRPLRAEDEGWEDAPGDDDVAVESR